MTEPDQNFERPVATIACPPALRPRQGGKVLPPSWILVHFWPSFNNQHAAWMEMTRIIISQEGSQCIERIGVDANRRITLDPSEFAELTKTVTAAVLNTIKNLLKLLSGQTFSGQFPGLREYAKSVCQTNSSLTSRTMDHHRPLRSSIILFTKSARTLWSGVSWRCFQIWQGQTRVSWSVHKSVDRKPGRLLRDWFKKCSQHPSG